MNKHDPLVALAWAACIPALLVCALIWPLAALIDWIWDT